MHISSQVVFHLTPKSTLKTHCSVGTFSTPSLSGISGTVGKAGASAYPPSQLGGNWTYPQKLLPWTWNLQFLVVPSGWFQIYMKNGCFTKHPLNFGGFGYQVVGWTAHLKTMLSSNWIISPGMKTKNIWNHHQVFMCLYNSSWKLYIQEISNRTHWTNSEKTWVSNSSIAPYWKGSAGKAPFNFWWNITWLLWFRQWASLQFKPSLALHTRDWWRVLCGSIHLQSSTVRP